MALLGSIATIALILTAFGLMLGMVKPADALKRVGAILGVLVLLTVLPAVLVNIWSGMLLWQQLGLAALGIAVWQLRRPLHRRRGDSRE
jgi:hypothetical protein